MKTYDYLVVGAGLFGSIFAYEASLRGKTCLVVDKRGQVGGNCFCQNWDGIEVHAYGAHIFHTHSEAVWNYVNAATPFRRYTHAVVANNAGELYSLPFNMHTFNKLWGVITPEQAQAKFALFQDASAVSEAQNLEERALALVGPEIYEKLIRHYTEKQWGRPCAELPAFIINRLPLRFTFDNNYFNDPYQGIPAGSYNDLFAFWLKNADVRLNCDFLQERGPLAELARKIVFTGPLDAYFDDCFGRLDYRGLRFAHERIEKPNVQGCAVMNYTDAETAFTRIIEHKHFKAPLLDTLAHSVITHEYPLTWSPGEEAYYPINSPANNALHARYKALADQEPAVLFGGRLADYRYYDMDDTVAKALEAVAGEFPD